MNSERCIVFLHMPKAGGATLRNVFRWKYQPSEVIRVQSLRKPLEDIAKIPLEERSGARVVMGHLHYGVHRYIPKECVYITMLREPLARVFSMYNYIKRDTKHFLHDELVRSGASLEEFVERSIDPSVDNQQTRLLSGRGSGDFVSGRRPPDLDKDALEEAKRNLESCLVVGLTETFNESFMLMRRALGWKFPLYIAGNVSKERRRPTEAELEVIRDRNKWDLELYDFARELNSAAIRDGGSSLRHEVAVFKAYNRISNKIGPRTELMIRRLYPSRFPKRPEPSKRS